MLSRSTIQKNRITATLSDKHFVTILLLVTEFVHKIFRLEWVVLQLT